MQLPERIYHLAEAVNLPSIHRCGLLPSSELIRSAYGSVSEQSRQACTRRREHTVLPTGVHIRDQGPIPEGALRSCLVRMAPPQWYLLLNAHVFFWLSAERLNRQRAACKGRLQSVLVVRTASLLALFEKHVFLTPINVGYALRRPAKRGRSTLVSYRDWVASGWLAEAQGLGTRVRPRSHQPVEMLVRGGMPIIDAVVEEVVELGPTQPFSPRDA